MKFVLMHLHRNGEAKTVTIKDVPQIYTDEGMIEYVKKKQLFGRHLRLFERPDRFEVVERDWPSPYKQNCVLRIGVADMLKEYDKYYNNISKRHCKAKQLTDKFTILNRQGDERSGDPNDWLVKDATGTLRVCMSRVFKGNYKRRN